MKNQKHLFNIPEDITYLNSASMGAILKSTNEAGRKALDEKSRPFTITGDDFFTPLATLRNQFAKLIDTEEPQRIAAISSASYGIATVTNNIVLKPGDEILIIENQFPSNVYSWERLAAKYNAKLVRVNKPKDKLNRAKNWSLYILEHITDKTAVIAMGHIHWTDGTIFDLKSISKKIKSHNGLLIIDGTQSIGALPFSIKDIQPDALICASYKWLLGPYSSGLAYYGPYFDHGIPLEESWVNRLDSEKFTGQYESEYKTQANRYNTGESANFIAVYMLQDSIAKILEWTPTYIQNHCHDISKHVIEPISKLGCIIEDSNFRAKHLFGIELPNDINLTELKKELEKQRIFVTIRGYYMRVSCHLFNTKEDFDALLGCLKTVIGD